MSLKWSLPILKILYAEFVKSFCSALHFVDKLNVTLWGLGFNLYCYLTDRWKDGGVMCV